MKKKLFFITKYEENKKTAKNLKAPLDWQIEKSNEFSQLVHRSKTEKDKFLASNPQLKLAFV